MAVEDWVDTGYDMDDIIEAERRRKEMREDALDWYYHIGQDGKPVDVRTISESYARNLFYWYERNYGCFDKYDSVMIMTLAERGNIDLAEVMGSRR